MEIFTNDDDLKIVNFAPDHLIINNGRYYYL